MDLQQIENEALHLSKEKRAQLIQRLVLSLESPSAEELRSDWLLEARRRAEEPKSLIVARFSRCQVKMS